MKKIICSAIAAVSILASCTSGTSQKGTSPWEARIDSVMQNMTLDEKVGQMCELTVETVVGMPGDSLVIDMEKLQTAIGQYKVGSILNAPGHALKREEWKRLINTIQEVSMREIGIPCIFGLDQNHGTTYTQGGTLFPQSINLAASFNPSLAEQGARICAYETRASNCPWVYNPTMDLMRDPRWARVWESFGEDPLVNAEMGSAQVRGYQGEDHDHIGPHNVGVSIKHFMGYGFARTAKDRTPAYMTIADMREKCFEPFRRCIELGATTLMVNSASINGVPVHANRELLTGWLKEELGWDGMIVTDWADINNLFTREHVAKDKKEAIAMAINAGIDMSMDPYDLQFCTLLKECVEEGLVPMSRIDDAVRRVLRLKFRLGLFDQPTTDMDEYPLFGSEEHAQVALNAARQTEVLLKNDDNILPLAEGKKILVTGPNANQMRCLNGGWSYSWQGHLADRYAGQYNTIYEAICNRFGAQNVVLEQGVTYVPEGAYYEENEPQIERAVAAARGVDVIVACIGENSYCETPGNLDDLALSSNQSNLVKALAKTGKPIVLILNEGRPRLISDIEPLAKGVIHVFLPSNYGADALAEILAGDVNPSAKMPYTYPRNPASLSLYDYRVSEETDRMEGAYDYDAVVSVQWPFGFGLSYTTFEYSNLQADLEGFTKDDDVQFSVDVTNTGSRAGEEVVMLFSRDMVASIVPENRRLRAFTRVALEPGETKTVTLSIKGSDLAFVRPDGRWTLEEGEFRMQVGNQTVMVNCSESYVWQTPNK